MNCCAAAGSGSTTRRRPAAAGFLPGALACSARPERAANIDVMRRETEMGKWLLGGTAAACAALAAFGASAAMASTHAGGVTIKVTDKGQTYVINKSATDSMYFSPGTASVKSGQTLTFTYEGKPAEEPHTISVVAEKDLPTTNAQINACSNGGDRVCNVIVAGHIKNPKAPPGPTNDIVHWTVDRGSRASTDPATASRSRAPSTRRSRSRSPRPPGRRSTSSASCTPGCTASSRSHRPICRRSRPRSSRRHVVAPVGSEGGRESRPAKRPASARSTS